MQAEKKHGEKNLQELGKTAQCAIQEHKGRCRDCTAYQTMIGVGERITKNQAVSLLIFYAT